MRHRRFIGVSLTMMLLWTMTVLTNTFSGNTVVQAHMQTAMRTLPIESDLGELHFQPGERPRPALSNEAYIRPEFAREMRQLRPSILAAARRHNLPKISGMSNEQFAIVIAAVLYNEHFGWFEEEVSPVRSLTPLYERLQVQANGAGANLSIWPANLRPSVAAEILEHHIPVPAPTNAITRTIVVEGSQIDPAKYDSTNALYAAISREISQPELAVEYLAANLQRGLYRAQFEDVPVTWRTLAAWHNQGLVAPRQIAANDVSASYVRRMSAYLPAARQLVETPLECHYKRCFVGDAAEFGAGPRW